MLQKGTYLFILLLKKFFFDHKACGILLLQPGIKPMSAALEAESKPLDRQGSPREGIYCQWWGNETAQIGLQGLWQAWERPCAELCLEQGVGMDGVQGPSCFGICLFCCRVSILMLPRCMGHCSRHQGHSQQTGQRRPGSTGTHCLVPTCAAPDEGRPLDAGCGWDRCPSFYRPQVCFEQEQMPGTDGVTRPHCEGGCWLAPGAPRPWRVFLGTLARRASLSLGAALGTQESAFCVGLNRTEKAWSDRHPKVLRN